MMGSAHDPHRTTSSPLRHAEIISELPEGIRTFVAISIPGRDTGDYCETEKRRLWRMSERFQSFPAPRGFSGNKMNTFSNRLWSKIEIRGPDECWPWKSKSRTKKGYGLIRRTGDGSKQTTAHRLAYEDKFGTVPEGQMVLHSCDNPPCCNPAHLFLGSGTDNAADRDGKGRGVAPPKHAGESHPLAKLTSSQVAEIRNSKGKLREIAALYRIGLSQVSAIRKGRSWK